MLLKSQQRVWVKDLVSLSTLFIDVTDLVSQLDMSPLKLSAPRKRPDIDRTEETSQADKSWSNSLHPRNITFIRSTADTFHLEISSLKVRLFSKKVFHAGYLTRIPVPDVTKLLFRAHGIDHPTIYGNLNIVLGNGRLDM